MGKFTNHKRLSKKEQEELFVDLARVISSVKSPVEAANLIRDLVSEQEAIMIARRIQIARCLDKGLTYRDIRKAVKVSEPTIARVQTWLQTYGEGFRTVIKRTKKTKNNLRVKEENLPWDRLKHQYPMYFWPQILLKQIVASASRKEKQKLLHVIYQMKQKTQLSKELKTFLSSNVA